MEAPLETDELKEQLEKALEHGEGGEKGDGGGQRWLTQLSLSTAFIAVVAAIASLQAGGFANEAILLKNDAVLKKSSASDKYNEYELRKLKSHIYSVQLDTLPPERKDVADKFRGIVDRELAEGRKPLADARRLDEESAVLDDESEVFLARHEIFARSVTVFQVAIALSAIAALTRKKRMWLFSMAVGALGAVFFVQGSIPRAKEPKSDPPAASAPAIERALGEKP